MALEEQLEMLRQGAVVWNAWRKEHPDVKPHLQGVNLHKASFQLFNLEGSHLCSAFLYEANLEGANLRKADIRGADLRKANLRGADLHKADLRGANLRKANLRGANLQGARLRGVTYYGSGYQEADLHGTDLTGANLQGVDLTEYDLRAVKLEAARLAGANLQAANLQAANLHGADLEGANLQAANLQGANLQAANLHEADLEGANLQAANLQGAHIQGANLQAANLEGVDLKGYDLHGVDLARANLSRANLQAANLEGANLEGANLRAADLLDARLRGANLRGADLQRVGLIRVTLDHAILTRCNVYGLSVWDIQGTPQDQSSLIITPPDAPTVTVDDLEVAQFIYLLLNREKLRNVINTITSKAVLILGRFTPERKVVLDALADELRTHNLLPIIFDFEGATTRDITETIKTLAGLSLFVIADITNPKSAPLELQATVPDYQIPFVAIIQQGERPFAMFQDLPKYPWVLEPIIAYPSVEKLVELFKEGILDPAWQMHQHLMEQKGRDVRTQSIEDFVQQRRG